MKRLLLPLVLFLIVTTPAAAQEPVQTQELGLYDRVTSALSPVRAFLEDYADLADGEVSTSAEDIWGAQLLSTESTGQGVTASSPPGGYYPDAPEQIRQAGYTLEDLTSRDISLMSALDFADWLGVTLALPFQIARGLQELVEMIGPLGFFLSWLMMAALWVGIVYFVSFLVSFLSNLLGIGSRVIDVIGLFKP